MTLSRLRRSLREIEGKHKIPNSIAMGNSDPRILPYCSYKTTDILDDGIYNAIIFHLPQKIPEHYMPLRIRLSLHTVHVELYGNTVLRHSRNTLTNQHGHVRIIRLLSA